MITINILIYDKNNKYELKIKSLTILLKDKIN